MILLVPSYILTSKGLGINLKRSYQISNNKEIVRISLSMLKTFSVYKLKRKNPFCQSLVKFSEKKSSLI